jgi:hypothetical protein
MLRICYAFPAFVLRFPQLFAFPFPLETAKEKEKQKVEA